MNNIQWRRVNDEPFEYAIRQGPHGDEFVKLADGSCHKRPIAPDEIVRTLGDDLAKECQAIFGSMWDNDVRWRLARAALRSLDEQGASEYSVRGLINGDLNTCDGYCHDQCN